MPMPKPKPNEEQSDWVSRCMSNPTMNDEFPDQAQRVAVCHQIWRDSKKSPTQDDWDALSNDIRAIAKAMKAGIDGTQ